MSPVRLIILVIAAGAAIGAVFLVRSMQQPAPAVAAVAPVEVKKPEPTKQVLVAKTAIPVGKFVVADDLKWQAWPEGSPTGAFIDQKADAEGLQKMVGAVARFDIVEGEPITATKLVHPGDSGFMAAMLAPGTRAVAIEISPETAAGGFIQPNDRVDVIVTREVEAAEGAKNSQNYRSDIILGNVRILAIDGIYAPPPAEGQAAPLIGSRATLELGERDTTLINAAKRAGELTLTLRSISDLQGPQGATPTGRVYRDGVSQGYEGIRIYRYGTESLASASAG
ncbi:MAG TPA: Flp pilus assembly protein CpaB [Hyphomonadaceae bacterium]|nr:Flp pilus assembly protein CpaB [Hyphomonadaceae bacterium]